MLAARAEGLFFLLFLIFADEQLLFPAYIFEAPPAAVPSPFRKKETEIKTQSDILLVDEDLAWHHSSATTALWSGGFDVQLFAEVYVETKNITI